MASSELFSKRSIPFVKSWGHTGRMVYKSLFDWTIDNLTLFCLKPAEYLDSPSFKVNNSLWRLQLHENQTEGFLSIYLALLFCNEDHVEVFHKFSIYNSKGENIHTCGGSKEQTFSKGTILGYRNFIKKETLLQDDLSLLYDDVTKINCNIAVLPDPQNVSGRFHSTSYNIPKCDLSEQFGLFLKNRKFSDVTFSVDDKEFHVHKAILAARSPVFFAMFEHDMCEKKQNIVTITDIKCDVFQELLGFIYTGEAPNIEDVACNLLVAADKYAISRLKVMCEEALSLKLSEENVLNTLILADMHNAEMLKSDSTAFLISHVANIVDSPEWKTFAIERPHLVEDAFYAISKEHSTIRTLCNNMRCLNHDNEN